MKIKNFTTTTSTLLIAFMVIFMASCKKNTNYTPPEETGIESLNIPSDFNFETTQTFQLSISDIDENVKYDVYSLSEKGIDEIIYQDNDTIVIVDDLNQKIASGFVKKGSFTTLVTIPSYHKYLMIVRNKNGVFVTKNIEITGNDIEYNYTGSTFKQLEIDNDVLYCVAGNTTKIRTIDLDNLNVSEVGNLPFTSIANAIDIVNNRMYTANNKSPFEFGYYDLSNNTFVKTGNMPWNFPRMDYNHADGMIYISKNSKLYKVDPATGQFLQTYNIIGFGNQGWGDLAFTNNGTIYFATADGIYGGTFSGTDVNVTKLSDNSLPKKLTSMAAGSNGKLYTTHNANKRIIEFDPTDGSWQYVYTSINITVNDFGMMRSVSPAQDSDGDGVPDDQEDYPNDPDRAFNNYFPGEDTWATLAYEDLWPSKGDYDFNDLVIGYNINQITNADNNVVEIYSKWKPKHNGASYENGFAFELGVDANNISSVSGTRYTGQYVNLNANGTEAGQTKANIVVFDETDPNIGTQLDVHVVLTNPASPVNVGAAPYNPYVIADSRLAYEVHLPGNKPTELADQTIFGTDDDTSDPGSGRYYKASTNLPWAINIVYDFVWMKEKEEITTGYLKFAEWAESGGSSYPDWYKDKTGYRNDAKLDIQ